MNEEELKQRLIELLEEAIRHADTNYQGREEDGKYCGLMVDYLLSNGVTIRERGEWIGLDRDTCSKCGHNLSEIMDADSYYAIGFDIKEIVACPFCGADMRGVSEPPETEKGGIQK